MKCCIFTTQKKDLVDIRVFAQAVDVLVEVRYNTCIHTKKDIKMLTQCIAKAKLVFNKKLQSYKLVVAFNAHKQFKKDKYGNEKVVYAFPTQAKCAYVSGDLLADNLQNELATVLPTVYATLRTNSVEFVD